MWVSNDILLFGHDMELLATRGLLVKSIGCAAETVDSLPKLKLSLASRSYRVVILCHTLSGTERGAAAAFAASLLPEVETLALDTWWEGELQCPLAHVFPIGAGPRKFCSVLRSLLPATSSSRFLTQRKVRMPLEGTVSWFNNAKGYGFLSRKDGGADVFAHFSSIQSSGYKTLNSGDAVTFEVVQGEKGPQADQVHVSKKT